MDPAFSVAEDSEVRSRPLVVIQRNPMSGSGRRRREIHELIRQLRRNQLQVRLFRNRDRLDEYVSRTEIRQQLRCIVAAGGDGTVADLVNRHPAVPLAILPMGTENLLARWLSIRCSGSQVAQMILHSEIRRLDSGHAGSRRFLLMCSAGIDARIVQQVHAARTGNIHHLNYAWPVLRAFFQYMPRPMEVVTEDGAHRATGTFVIVTNIPAYGFGFQFAPDAVPGDGLLDVHLFQGTTRMSALCHAGHVRLSSPWRDAGVVRFRTNSLRIRPVSDQDEIPVQNDGDPGGVLPLTIRTDPESLTLLVPASAARDQDLCS